MTNSIEVSKLSKSYEGFSLRDVSFVLPTGSIMGLIGENGAGKTTTIKCLLNLIRRDSGHITLLGQDVLRNEQAVKQDIGVVLDDCFFHDSLTPKNIHQILSPIYTNWDASLFFQYLKRFDLPEGKPLKEFSRGMKMKLSLSAALSHHPKLLILDEPTAGLDPVARDEILDEFLSFIQDEARSILICSHILSDLEKVADYITYLHQGQVQLSDSKDSILEHYGRVACTSTQLETVAPGDLLRVRKGAYGCEGLTADRARFQYTYPSLMVEPISLEEIMLFIGKEDHA